jgi:hypothetical protein
MVLFSIICMVQILAGLCQIGFVYRIISIHLSIPSPAQQQEVLVSFQF